MVKTGDGEPRVGRTKTVPTIKDEANDFLRQLRQAEVIKSDHQLACRSAEVVREIDTNTVEVQPSTSRNTAVKTAGPWFQSYEELQHGVRLAWLHAPKCIMRSEYQSLRLFDFRHVESSIEMGKVLLEGLVESFNHGDIAPAVYVFPPRQPGTRGPMIWNGQLLSFAGYPQEDGSVLGDPANVKLTQAIIELGWQPPEFRSRWDLLPIVTMAEGDEPAIFEVPQEHFPLVCIEHPKYSLPFQKLGLKWVPAPALSRLGFDIGGVEYTATPFIGWFMDAEIAVRDLADSFRYNALPDVIRALGWLDSSQSLEALPEHERLLLLSRAQAELNFAVYHSFRQAGVRMTDSMSASAIFSQFDDEYSSQHGYRLPSNPYWLAPPQGSIIPLWHRGGAPNYNPSPLICKHVQDPVNAWRRENRCPFAIGFAKDSGYASSGDSASESDVLESGPAIHIAYCSTATTAKKLATKLHDSLADAVHATCPTERSVKSVVCLNDVPIQDLRAQDTLLIIASSAHEGSVPLNGARFLASVRAGSASIRAQFSVFGNGDTTYADTYNGAAQSIVAALTRHGAQPLETKLFAADTAIQNPPWRALEEWLCQIKQDLELEEYDSDSSGDLSSSSDDVQTDSFSTARVVSKVGNDPTGLQQVTISVKELSHEPLSHLKLHVPNEGNAVRNALRALGLKGGEIVSRFQKSTAFAFLTNFADFDRPFKHISWASPLELGESERQLLTSLPWPKAVKILRKEQRLACNLEGIIAALPTSVPRTYSIASSQDLMSRRNRTNHLDLVIQPRVGGKASEFFRKAKFGQQLVVRISSSGTEWLTGSRGKPVICFATGSGLAPIRSFLQHRLHEHIDGKTRSDNVTLLLGYHGKDAEMIARAVQPFLSAGIVDTLLMTPSNAEKARVQDKLLDERVRQAVGNKIRFEGASVLVCAGVEAAEDFAGNLSAIVGRDVREALGQRYMQEVFEPAV
ncbi:Nitric oxide synthase [Teratosphaeria destructans]|uniref:nitric-oxide synthase (NADPH) n=1 Tax=Teratosphaeria destructans TaxID=418781 RepID=A0A9W7VYI6_9PEZI|nr:Nitric oxide synthase [Teratosphaeria destructans]